MRSLGSRAPLRDRAQRRAAGARGTRLPGRAQWRLLGAVLAVATMIVFAHARAPGRGVGTIPALPRLGTGRVVDTNDVGDPYIIAIPPVKGSRLARFLRVGTTDWQSNVPAAVSTDLVHWVDVPDALPALPVWAAPTVSMTWAPAVMRTAREWVLYYSTQERAGGMECLGRATSRQPTGPYVDSSKSPLVCQRALGGSIDPSLISSRSSTYLVWKNNGNSVRVTDSIWLQRLAPSGLAVTGPVHRLLSTDLPWQHGVIEAPAMVPATGGGWWLFYSGGSWNSDAYTTGLAYCPKLDGPCGESSDKPFLRSTATALSPGGLDTFTDAHQRLWAAFTTLVPVPSTWHPGHLYYNRVLDIAPFISR